MEKRSAYRDFVLAASTEGSGKTSSYLRALDMLGGILEQSDGEFHDISDLWQENSAKKIDQLYDYILLQQSSGELFSTDHPPSYWRSRFYSAALREYRLFLVEWTHTEKLSAIYETQEEHNPNEFELALEDQELLKDDLSEREGRDVVRKVKTRAGHEAFRNRIMQNYQSTCCVTGLDLPQLNEASHIISWSERRETRLDPRNGLCLSATYHKAFDRYLIGFDDNYRMILSKRLLDQCQNKVVRDYFETFEGQAIQPPKAQPPRLDLLAEHRKKVIKFPN